MTNEQKQEHILRLSESVSKEPLALEMSFSAKASELIREAARTLHIQSADVVSRALELGLPQVLAATNKISDQLTAKLKPASINGVGTEQGGSTAISDGPNGPKERPRISSGAKLGHKLQP